MSDKESKKFTDINGVSRDIYYNIPLMEMMLKAIKDNSEIIITPASVNFYPKEKSSKAIEFWKEDNEFIYEVFKDYLNEGNVRDEE